MAAIGVFAVVRARPPADTPVWGYTVVAEYPHEATSFTQGLTYHDGFLYESTGKYGASSVRRVDLETGKANRIQPLPRRFFGEGIAVSDDHLVQLTYRSGIGFVRDIESFNVTKQFRYKGQGWGITRDKTRLIMSDGTATLRLLDPNTFEVTGKLPVTEQGRPVLYLNELEMVRGEIYANVWQSQRIARISPQTGHVLGWIDLSGLKSRAVAKAPPGRRPDVLNGIAYDAAKDRLFVTGKYWPTLFEIRVTPREPK